MILRLTIALILSLLLPTQDVHAYSSGGSEERIEVVAQSAEIVSVARQKRSGRKNNAPLFISSENVTPVVKQRTSYSENTHPDLYLRYRSLLI